MNLQRAVLDNHHRRKEEDVPVAVLELPVGQVELTGSEITQDDHLGIEIPRADDADDLDGNVAAGAGGGLARGGINVRVGRSRLWVGLRRGQGGGSRFKVAVVPV